MSKQTQGTETIHDNKLTQKREPKERKPRQLTVEQITNQAAGLSNAYFSQLIQNLDKMKEERREKAKQELEALG